MVKQQNQFLLAQIAKDYNKNEKSLQQLYWTPSFYKIIFDKNIYHIQYNK